MLIDDFFQLADYHDLQLNEISLLVQKGKVRKDFDDENEPTRTAASVGTSMQSQRTSRSYFPNRNFTVILLDFLPCSLSIRLDML